MGEDMNLPRLYYTLPELAGKWGKTENDLLQMAAAGGLRLSVKHYGTGHNEEGTEVIDGYVQLYSQDCEGILEFGCEAKCQLIYSVIWKDEHFYIIDEYELEKHSIRNALIHEYGENCNKFLEQVAFDRAGIPGGVPANSLTVRDISDLLILPDEAARVEAIYPELAGTIPFFTDDEYVYGNKEIENESGISFNTFDLFAGLAGIPIGKTEGNNPKNTIKKSDIRRVLRFREEYKKKNKK